MGASISGELAKPSFALKAPQIDLPVTNPKVHLPDPDVRRSCHPLSRRPVTTG